jgi:ABC-type Fe3+ transport system substrate-binding protein
LKKKDSWKLAKASMGRKKMKKGFGYLLCLMLLSMLVASSLPVNVKASTVTLTIISPHPSEIKDEYEAAFDAYYFSITGDHVDITWIDVGGTSNDMVYVDNTFAANGEATCNIDIWWGGGVDPFISEKAKGHLYSYQVNSTLLSLIPSNISGIPMYDSDYTWYGTALSGFGIIYNKVVVAAQGLPTPKTWEDLTNPKLKGWVGSADPRNSGSTHMCYELMLQAYGWQKGLRIATLLGANVKSWPISSSAIPVSVTSGDIAYGLCIDYYAWAQIAKVGANKIGYVLPSGNATVINPDSIAILKGAPNLGLAKTFVDYVLSPTGQKLLMLPTGVPGGPTTKVLGRMSILPSLYTQLGNQSIVPLNPFTVKAMTNYNATKGSLRYSLINDLIGAMVIDSKDKLTSVWGEIISANTTFINAGRTPSTKISDAINMLCNTPITEAQGLSLGASWDINATLKNTKITEWHTYALAKYDNASTLSKLASLELVTYFNSLINQLNTDKTNNLYIGLGGGTVLGIVIGVGVYFFMARRKEIAAVKA